jgi:DNA-binding NarL/FixJ family response regulator
VIPLLQGRRHEPSQKDNAAHQSEAEDYLDPGRGLQQVGDNEEQNKEPNERRGRDETPQSPPELGTHHRVGRRSARHRHFLSSLAHAYHHVMTQEEPVRVVLIDDHDLLRRGMKTMLERQGSIEVVGEADDGDQALELVEKTVPDVVIIDVIMPRKDGIEATREIKEAYPHVGVVVLSGHDEQQFVFDALKAGASGYLTKTAELEEVVSTIEAVAKGQGKIDPTIATKVLSEFRSYQKAVIPDVFQPLTPREREILKLMSDGLPNKTIASRLAISERTVTTHVANIYSKLQVNNRVSAIQEAMRRRILDYTP